MWSKLVLKRRRPLLWVVSGPSGSGKTTLYRRLLRKKQLNITRSISFTTRPLRKGEKNRKDYIFVSREEFLRRKRRGEFIEWQEVFGNLYGTSKKTVYELLSKNKDVLLCIDVKGALEIKKKFLKKAVFIFIVPPSEKKLVQRIKARAREGQKEIERRIRHAKVELSFAKEYDYIVVNDELREAVSVLESIITTKRMENVLRTSRKDYR